MLLTAEQKCLLWLSNAEVTPGHLQKLLETYSSVQEIWERFGREDGPRFPSAACKVLKETHSPAMIDALAEKLEHKNVNLLFQTGRKHCAGRIQAGMNALRFCTSEKLNEKVHLEHRFAARRRDAAPGVKRPVSSELVHQFRYAYPPSRPRFPCIRIMAVYAAQRTPLKKDDKTDAGAIHSAKALYGVDISCRRMQLLRSGHGMCGKSLHPAALLSASRN